MFSDCGAHLQDSLLTQNRNVFPSAVLCPQWHNNTINKMMRLLTKAWSHMGQNPGPSAGEAHSNVSRPPSLLHLTMSFYHHTSCVLPMHLGKSLISFMDSNLKLFFFSLTTLQSAVSGSLFCLYCKQTNSKRLQTFLQVVKMFSSITNQTNHYDQEHYLPSSKK